MGHYYNDGNTSELTLTDLARVSGRNDISFTVSARSRGFQATMSQIWFDGDDVLAFVQAARPVSQEARGRAELRAMTKLVLSLEPADRRGGFAVTVELEDLSHGNKATIRLELPAQTVDELLGELERAANQTKG